MNIVLNEYEKVTKNLRKEITKKLKKLLKDNNYIIFDELVSLHFISDEIYTDLKRIDKDMLCYVNIHYNSSTPRDTFTYGLEELDASALYELLLALEEKTIKFS